MSHITYVGVNSKKQYVWDLTVLPAGLQASNGGAALIGTWNNETVIQTTDAGDIQRGTKGNPSASDPYSPGYAPSLWEQQ